MATILVIHEGVVNVVAFPTRPVLDAVRALEANVGPDVDELAASVLVVALQQRHAVPPWTLRLLLSVMLRNVGHPLSRKLAASLAAHVDDLEVVVVGLRLAEHDDPHRRVIGDLVLKNL